MIRRATPLFLVLAACTVAPPDSASGQPARRTENVILVTLDGLRWQEVFGGADNALMNAEHGGIRDLLATRRRFWRGDPVARRELLMPFLWGELARRGQLFGDPERDSPCLLTNGLKFSYPGYQEILCGFADPAIDSNAKRPNPNASVLEWLHRRPAFAGRVAAFSGWDVFPYILNRQRSGIAMHCGWEPIPAVGDPQAAALLQRVSDQLPRYWEGFRWDAITFQAALQSLRHERPRVLYLSLGETDEWAHARRYDLYLQMARAADDMLAELWRTVQSMDGYRDRTSLIVTVDHGRGSGPDDWTSHGKDIEGAEYVWIGVLGPDTGALGVRSGVSTTQGQVAATLAALLGLDWTAAEPRAAPPLPGVLPERRWAP